MPETPPMPIDRYHGNSLDNHNTGAVPGPGYNAVLEVRNGLGVLVARYFLYDSPIPWSADMDVLWEENVPAKYKEATPPGYQTLLIFRALDLTPVSDLETE